MCNIMIKVPDELLLSLHKSQEEFESYAKLSLAIDLYMSGNVSLGYCTAIADISKREFIKELGKRQISIFQFDSEEDLMEDVRNA